LDGLEEPSYGALIEPLPPITDAASEAVAIRGGPRLNAMWQEAKRNVRQDYINYYSWDNLRDLAIGFAVAAPLANTSVDGGFRDWYQDDVRSSGTDNLASFFKTFGEGQIFIPSFAVLAVTGQYFADRPLLAGVGDYSGRVTRAYLVGAPPMLLMQFVTGAGRPGEHESGSHWQPFRDSNGVSGHAFMGSVPFITAARMTENPLAKATLYGLSTFTGWSRINDDDHYLSQVILGWWMGYLACRAVDDAQQLNKHLTLTPIATPGMVGVGMVYSR
jgi:membrane-associated phospholipid phosphatase